ncbi:MAG TPA: leucyl aminopeptidase [Planctomycetaceae bacterium]|jgi:leucyl aminopeptidase|nr:leucyl aminopeptidase [Planctomycetaceae bacterium]
MNIHTVTTPWQSTGGDWLIVGVTEPPNFAGSLKALDDTLGGRLTRLRELGDVTGKHAELVPIRDAAPLEAKRLLLVGLGKPEELTLPRYERALLTAVRSISEKKCGELAVAIESPTNSKLSTADLTQTVAFAATVGGVGQGLFKSEPARFSFDDVSLAVAVGADSADVKAAAKRGHVLGEAVNVVRELVNLPAGDLYPETFAERSNQLAQDFGISCGVFDENWLKQERMGCMLAVAQASDRPPRLVVLKYDGDPGHSRRLAFVGKGVTFDSGGLSIKSNDNMLTMKCDMAGAATVLGAILAIARLKLPVNVSGYMGLVENMVSGNSYKLGDVLKSRSGITVEINNTDAEGRLVLSDVLQYAVDDGADRLIDLATLTGSCVVALGEDVAGAFSNDQPWCDAVLSAAKRAGEDLWQLPMFDHFSEQLKSDVADVKNTGSRWGGSITAAKFLEKFVDKRPWVHLDIAGPAFAAASKPHREGGGTGCMVRTLVEVAAGFKKAAAG